MDESEEVTAHSRRLRGHDTLGGNRSNRSIDGVAALLNDLSSGFGRKVVRCDDRV